jgi:hypothetical protein
MKFTIRLKGGAGSGHHGHKGRPGEQGGSLPGDALNSSIHLRGHEAAAMHDMIGRSVISWDGKDVLDLNNKIKSFIRKNNPDAFKSERDFFGAVETLLNKSNIRLDEGQFDELGTIFDSWIPDEIENYREEI